MAAFAVRFRLYQQKGSKLLEMLSCKRRSQMKRAILLMALMMSLTFGPGRAYAFPSGPCNPKGGQSAASGLSPVQLAWLLVPVIASSIR